MVALVRKYRNPLQHILILAVSLTVLYLTSLSSYLLFHSLTELYSIIVAYSVFIIGWASRRSMNNGYLLFLGIAFLFIAGMDTLHTLSYKGMGVFTNAGTNLPTQLWIATRYVQSISLLIAPLFLKRKVNPIWTIISFTVAVAILLVSIFQGVFPACYVEGVGLTPFKIISEYVISAILLGALWLLVVNREKFDSDVMRWLEIALGASIFSEVAFTDYASVVGFANLVGHMLKIVAFYSLFQAIVETGFYRPFNLLLRDVKQNEAALRKAQGELEQRVTERTQQLAQSNQELRKEIAERERAEAASRESEARFRAIYEESPLGIAVIGRDGLIQASNPILSKILGYDDGKSLSGCVHDYIAAQDRPIHEKLFSALVYREIENYHLELRCLNQAGKPVWTHLSMSLVKGDTHQVGFAFAMVEDISQRRQAQDELAEVQRRLIDSQEHERLSLARDLHDGPIQDLTAASFQLQIQREETDPEKASVLASIQETVTGVSKTLREICGQLRPQALTPFGLEKAIRSHAAQFQEEHPDIQIHLELWLDGQELSEDIRLALYRIYQQALNNIAQHAQATQVNICFQKDTEYLWLEIEDNGQGFELPRGWIQFVRNGHLGMAGMAERAQAIGGKYSVISKPGQGTRIRVEVPV